MELLEVYKEVAEKLDLPVEVVKETYKSYWKWVSEEIRSYVPGDYKSINIPAIGKFSMSPERYKGLENCRRISSSIKHAKDQQNTTTILNGGDDKRDLGH